MKRIIHFTLLILLLNICYLFSPKPTPDTNFCGEYIPLNSYAGYIRNCDANEFLESAINPSALMRENYVRQNRPIYIIIASIIGYGIYYTFNVFGGVDLIDIGNSIYIAYVFLNFIILLLTLILFEKIALQLTDSKISYTSILLLSVFITSNFMTKAFFWTAHQQMMAFFIPLLSIYICMNFKKMSSKWLSTLFFMCGVGMLAYGSFLILFSVCILYLIYTLYVQKILFTYYAFIILSIGTVLFILPTTVWVLFLKYKDVVYYNHEVVRYRQIVWMSDAISISFISFLSAVYINLCAFLKTTSKLFPFVILLVFTFYIKKIKTGTVLQWDRNFKLIVLNLFCFGCFFIILGYYAFRLTFTLMPIILCLSIANTDNLLSTKNVKIALFVIVSIWHTINVFSYGPFS